MNKRILITARLYGPGGHETHLFHLCQLLADAGAQITLVTRFVGDRDIPLVQHRKEIPLRLISTPFADDLSMFRLSTVHATLAWPLKVPLRSFDVLYTMELSPFTDFLRLFLKKGAEIVFNDTGDVEDASDGIKQTRDATLFSVPGCYVVESRTHRSVCEKHVPDASSIRVAQHIGNVRDASLLEGPSRETIRVAFLGRFDRDKGVLKLLDLWPDLSIGPARLDFYGGGPLKSELESRAQEEEVQDSVFVQSGWDGPMELKKILAEVDFVVLPSKAEGLPLVLLESVAHGIPFVATSVGAIPELEETIPNVHVVANNKESLKKGIVKMCREIKKCSIDRPKIKESYEENFGYEELSREWKDILLNES